MVWYRVVTEKRNVAFRCLCVDRFGWRFKEHSPRLICGFQVICAWNLVSCYGFRIMPQSMFAVDIIFALGCRDGEISGISQ